MERNWQKAPESKNEFAIEGGVVWIKLTQGQETCVDLEDWPKVREFTWRAQRAQKGFYAVSNEPASKVNPKRGTLLLHKVLLSCPGEVDHRDQDKLNNKDMNLRPATHSQNQANKTIDPRNTAGFRGVCRNGASFVARIGSNGNRQEYLGIFDSPVVAAVAYDRAAIEKYGEFAHLNFPRGQFGAFAL